MSGDSEMAISDMSMAESTFRGAAEAPRGAGARAAREERGATLRPCQSLVFPAMGQIAGFAAMDAFAAIALGKDAIKEDLWRITLGNPALLALLHELDGVIEVRCGLLT